MKELDDYIYGLLAVDADLISIMGQNPPQMFPRQAPPGRKPPYIVYHSQHHGLCVVQGDYFFELYTAGENDDQINQMRDRLVALLGRICPFPGQSQPSISGIIGLRFGYEEGDFPIQVNSHLDRGLEVRFWFRFASTKDTNAVLNP